MSVLYKALQKAERDNEERAASSGGFDPSRLAGSGAIKIAGKRRMNRATTLGILGAMALAMVGSLVLVRPQPAPRPRVAALSPAPQQQTPVAPSPTPATDAPSSPAQVTQAPQQPAPQDASGSTPQAPTQANQAVVAAAPAAPTNAAPAAVPQAPAATPGTTAAPAAAAPQAPGATVAENAAPPATSLPQLPPTPADASPAAPAPKDQFQTARVEPAKPAPSRAAPVMPTAPADIPRDSPANMLSPPITISRSEFALSGVGRQVQVREVSQEAQNNASAGYNALLRGQYDTALGFYDHALEREPNSILVLLGRGAALQKMHRFEDAQTVYTKVLKLDPANREALTNMTSLIVERSPSDALNKLLDLDREYPNFSPISAEIGLAYAKLGTMDQALIYLRKAIAQSPESVMYQYNLALVLDHMGLREQAIGAYESVLSDLRTGRGAPELSTPEIERRVQFLRVK